jgi:hypothetical protein
MINTGYSSNGSYYGSFFESESIFIWAKTVHWQRNEISEALITMNPKSHNLEEQAGKVGFKK